MSFFPPRLGYIFSQFLQSILGAFLFLFPSESTIMWTAHWMLSQQSHNVSFLFKVPFFILLLCLGEFHCFASAPRFTLLPHLFCCWALLMYFLVQLLLLFASFFVLYVEVCAMSIHFSPKLNTYVYIIIFNSSGRLLISVSMSSFSGVLPCSFDWNIFLCLLILHNSVCLHLCVWQISSIFQICFMACHGLFLQLRLYLHFKILYISVAEYNILWFN